MVRLIKNDNQEVWKKKLNSPANLAATPMIVSLALSLMLAKPLTKVGGSVVVVNWVVVVIKSVVVVINSVVVVINSVVVRAWVVVTSIAKLFLKNF